MKIPATTTARLLDELKPSLTDFMQRIHKLDDHQTSILNVAIGMTIIAVIKELEKNNVDDGQQTNENSQKTY